MNLKQRAMCLRILDHYGAENQAKQTIEECGELIVALRHYERGKATKSDVIDEIADIIVMGEQMRHVFGYADVEARVDEKLVRKIQEIQADAVKLNDWDKRYIEMICEEEGRDDN